MTREVIMLDADDSLQDAINTFNNHSIRHAPVFSKGELLGMLSWLDIKRLAIPVPVTGQEADGMQHISWQLCVGDIMTPDPVTLQVEDSIRDLAQIFVEHEFHAVPVLEGERLTGIVSTTDLIQFFLDNSTD